MLLIIYSAKFISSFINFKNTFSKINDLINNNLIKLNLGETNTAESPVNTTKISERHLKSDLLDFTLRIFGNFAIQISCLYLKYLAKAFWNLITRSIYSLIMIRYYKVF
ncbi:hypothetical protein BpHYR1_053098 [Brachionus plicatilis]|uniref:Uncharacterized protein n=1 Tax=Brachionus plicatilis TaxID=10195 RepID=A0A3M7R4H7_BRAPC|nr:hypothetical protein BpHYR1_053098 [Brachionus plicatilis]